jgi:hypothetical protein
MSDPLTRSVQAVSTAIALSVGFTLFRSTEPSWYDRLLVDQQTAFWVNAAVAFGTLALAVTTWVSVRTSRNIIAAEDLRFRQARMPMVAASVTKRQYGGAYIELRNDGDGPARNVRLTFDAHTRLTWNHSGSPDSEDDDQFDDNDVAAKDVLFASFMPVGQAGAQSTLFGAYDYLEATAEDGLRGSQSIKFRELTIRYEDVFGAKYLTTHDTSVGGDLVPRRFEWMPPKELVGGDGP